MAAKVAMVAVPAALGIASIRVYTIHETPSDGLGTRQRLNIYSPLAESSQANVVSESPGVIESGITFTREGLLPIFQAVKGACVSIKGGTINLYHAGEDVYYYLKDPPPGFLPRVGTISMAGLLGMFLARKGSRFKRLALPLGLTCAGASVCYPAQAVAVCKTTGRKVYAAGQWSITSVSSLFTSTEPSRLQLVPVPNAESSVSHEASAPSTTAETSPQSSTIPEDDVESAQSVPIPSEPGVAKEKPSTQVSDPVPTETNENSLCAENGTLKEESDISAPVEVEVAPVEVESAPLEVESAPVEVESAPVEVESAPVEVESAPVEVESAPVDVQSAPVEVESAPVEVESAPVEVESAPVEVESAPVEVEAAPVEVEAAPVEVEAAPVEVESAPVEVEASPVEVEVAPVEVEVAPVEVEVAPVEVEVAPVEVEVAPVEVEVAPVEVEASPVEVEVAPVEVEVAPVDVEVAPVDVEVAPVDVEVAPVEVEVAPVEVEVAPVEVEVAPVEVEVAPVEVEVAPVEVEVALVEPSPLEATPVEDAPAEDAPAEDAPAEVTPVEATPAEATPVEAESEASPVEPSPVSEEPSIPQAFLDLEASLTKPSAADEPQITDHTPDSPSPAADISKEGSGFKADPSIMDFGQSSPEDADLYSTRS